VFWEHDGIKIKVGRRSATREVLGRVNVGINQHLVAGDRFTRFVDQLDVGDQIVIRGQNHTVSRVVGQSEMYITPTYRGSINAAEARMSVIDTLLVPQEQSIRLCARQDQDADGCYPVHLVWCRLH